jgi:hypothetical protein
VIETDPVYVCVALMELRQDIEEATRTGDHELAEDLRGRYLSVVARMDAAQVADRLAEVVDDLGGPLPRDPMWVVGAIMIGPAADTGDEAPPWERALAQARATVGKRMVLVLCGEPDCPNVVAEVVETKPCPMFRSWPRSDVVAALKPDGMHDGHNLATGAAPLPPRGW